MQMKKTIIALLLLLVIALAACASGTKLEKSGKDPNTIHHSADRRADDQDITDVDVGMIDGNTYKNVDLAVCAAFPEGWYLYSEDEVAELNDLDAATFDRAAILDAVKAGQDVVVFCASDPATLSSVRISASVNPLPGADPDALVNHFAPLVEAQYEQSGALQNLSCVPFDVDYCGEDHVTLSVTGDANGTQLYETYLYFPCGDLLYTMTVSTTQADMTADILNCFTALN